MRAWIEIVLLFLPYGFRSVALFMRAWIEIQRAVIIQIMKREVALFMRAWIEISLYENKSSWNNCRPLHEGVA